MSILTGASVVVLYLSLVPFIFLIIKTFSSPKGLFANYAKLISSPLTIELLRNSCLFAAGSTVLTFLIGVGLAFLLVRTNTPFRGYFFSLSLIPMIMPAILFNIAWIYLLSPRIGIINSALKYAGLPVVFNIFSFGGMIFVESLHLSPIVFLLMVATFRSIDPALEEAAVVSGAGMAGCFFRVTLPLAFPGLAAAGLISFVRALEAFETPALLGVPVRIQVFTSRIYFALHSYPADIGMASTYAMILVAFTSLGVYLISRFSKHSKKYATITGKAFRPRLIDIGRWRYVAGGGLILYFLMMIGLPLFVLLWSSLQPFYTVKFLASLQNISLINYREVFHQPLITQSLINSLILSLTTATAVMLLSSLVAWIVVRTKMRGRFILDNLTALPMVFPGLVVGLALMLTYIYIPLPIYGTLWILLIAYMTRYLPYGMRYVTPSMLQIQPELEEAGHIAGATWREVFFLIILPLIKPGLLSGWIYIVTISIRELSSSILLYSPGSEVLSITIWEMWNNGQFVQLSALGMMMIVLLVIITTIALYLSRHYGVREEAF